MNKLSLNEYESKYDTFIKKTFLIMSVFVPANLQTGWADIGAIFTGR